MSFKQEIETWVKAVGQYDNHEFEESLRTFEEISDTAKILFNCGIIHATLGQHHMAVECYQRAIARDQFLAIAFFQQGVSNFLMGDFEEALANFNDTLLMLRGNKFINYDQLGLKYKLYSCTVLFNRGLCYTYMMQKAIGLQDLKFAAQEKVTEEHDVIDEAIRDDADGYTVFSIGVGTLYRPSSAKVKNLKSKDYLGKARLIAAAEQGTNYIASADPKRAVLAAVAEKAGDDRPPETISFAASNLVRPNLHSRSRQQSEPPVHRNMFPPTPPPESEIKRPFMPSTSTLPPANLPLRDLPQQHPQPQQSQLRPEPLKLQKSTFTPLEKDLPQHPPPPRLGTHRTASEPRGPSTRRISSSSHTSQDPPRRLYMEAIPSRPRSGGEADIDEYPTELLQMDPSLRQPQQQHPHPTNTHHRNRRSTTHHPSIVEEDETAANDSSHSATNSTSTSSPSSVDGFEMLHNAGGGLSRPPAQRSQSSRPTASHPASSRRARSSSRHHHHGHSHRASSRRPSAPVEMRQLRVKVHRGDDTRYMMVAPGVGFAAFLERVREKFGLKGEGGWKLKIRDEGDLITMGDVDDWDVAVEGARREMAKVEEVEGSGEGMGKMEVWVFEGGRVAETS